MSKWLRNEFVEGRLNFLKTRQVENSKDGSVAGMISPRTPSSASFFATFKTPSGVDVDVFFGILIFERKWEFGKGYSLSVFADF